MKAPASLRFTFTQISGIIVMGATALGIAANIFAYDDSWLLAGLALLIYVTAMLVAAKLWGRLLVALGLLARHEAKGYPFATPWDKNE